MRVLFIIILATVGFFDWTILRISREDGQNREAGVPNRKPDGK